MSNPEIEQGILTTGFKLEFDVSAVLADHGWTTINNKYYIDDLQESVREIDLVAYKSSVVQDFRVYTALIISCKKSEETNWALLGKDLEPSNPNYDWSPVHAWSNDVALSCELGQDDWRNDYFKHLRSKKVTMLSAKPTKHIFAFQEMKKSNGKPNNDKNIFNSVVSLIKAQAYELSALPNRKKTPCVYQFNLLSIVDSNLFRIDFSTAAVSAEEVSDEVYVAGYIVNKQQTICRIHFMRANRFDYLLKKYDRLHLANQHAFGEICDGFYAQVFDSHDRWVTIRSAFADDLGWEAKRKIQQLIGKSVDLEKVWFDLERGVLKLWLDVEEEEANILNENRELMTLIGNALRKHYRYEGKFKIDKDPIPF